MICAVDGATPLEGGEEAKIATARFAELVADACSRKITSPHDVRGQVAQAMTEVQTQCEAVGTSSTLAVSVWDQTELAVGVMGDSPVYVHFKDGSVFRTIDPAFDGREEKFLRQVSLSLSDGLLPADAYRKVKSQLLADRQKRNTESGVWVLSDSDDPYRIAEHVHVATFPVHEVASVTALTDGCEALFRTFDVLTREELLCGNKEVLSRAYEHGDVLQNADSDRTRFPRLSDRDDASFVQVVF